MKNILYIIIILLYSVNSFAQGIEFFHGTWEEALQLAKTQDKIIFVDGFAKWCGPCKRMAATVFTDEKVGNFYNQNFINMKLDLEEGEGVKFRTKYPVSAFPTLFYIDADGKVVHSQRGALQVDPFVDLGKMVQGKNDKSADFEKEYQNGNREPEFILKYIQALNKAGKSPLKIANDYLMTKKNDTSAPTLKIIFESASEADSRIFDLLIANKANIGTLVTTDAAVQEKIESACARTASKAIDFKTESLLREAQNKMKTYAPDKAKAFAMNTDMQYYLATKDANGYLKAAALYQKEVIKNDANKTHDLATKIYQNFGTDAKAMKEAEKLAKKAANNGGLPEYYTTYALVLTKNGKKKDAIAAANKSIEIAKETGKPSMQAQQLLEELQKS